MAAIDVRSMVDADGGLIDRRIFSEPAIYEQELERIFARCGLYLGHESQLAQPGAFLTTYLSEDLGARGWWLDVRRGRLQAGTEVLGGAHRWVLPASWRTAAENFGRDAYHAPLPRGSAFRSGFGGGGPRGLNNQGDGFQISP